MSFFKSLKDTIAIIFLSTVIVTYLLNFLGFNLDYIFGDLVDGRLNNYFLEHGFRFVIGHYHSFWSPSFYFPVENVLVYSDNHIGTLPLYSFYRLLGLDIETAYQAWIISIFILNGLSAYLVLRLSNFNILGSLIGAMIFTMSAPVMLKTFHIQMIPRFMVPLIFYAGCKFAETLRVKYFYLCSFAFLYQFYIGIYVGFFALLALFFLAPFAFLYIKRKHDVRDLFNKKNLCHILFVISISIVFLLFLFYPYMSYKVAYGGRSWHEIASMLPRFQSWIYSSGYFFDYFNRVGKNLPMQHEHFMFMGIIPIILFFYTLFVFVKKRYQGFFIDDNIIVVTSLLTIGLVFIITLYLQGFSIYKYTLFQVPGFDAIRAVSRVIVFLSFPFAVLISFFITCLSKVGCGVWKKSLALLFVIVLIGFEQYRNKLPVYSKETAQERYMSLLDQIKDENGYDVIYLKRTKPDASFYIHELDAMFLSLLIDKPTINGYSGNLPRHYNLWTDNELSNWVLKNNKQLMNKNIAVISDVGFNIFDVEDIKDKQISKQIYPLKVHANRINLLGFKRRSQNKLEFNLRVTNLSNEYWHSLYDGKYSIALAYSIGADQNSFDSNDRILLPYDIASGESFETSIIIDDPHGDISTVRFSMVQESVSWFHDNGSSELVVDIR